MRVARQAGITIYAIGVGNDEQTMRELLQQNNIASGTALNEPILEQIAALTGGQYFRARDSAALEDIYRALDRLEPAPFEATVHRHRQSLLRYPLLLCLIVLLLAMAPRRRSRQTGQFVARG